MVPHGDDRGNGSPRRSARTREPPRIIAPMLLAIDIGNTNVTIGLLRNGALVATRRAATTPRATADEFEFTLDGLLHLDDALVRRRRCDRLRLGRARADRARRGRSPRAGSGR